MDSHKDTTGRMYHNMWINKMIGKLDHGMYWHIPRSESILRIDKKRDRFIILKGNKSDPELRSLSNELRKIGYKLITRDEEEGVYLC